MLALDGLFLPHLLPESRRAGTSRNWANQEIVDLAAKRRSSSRTKAAYDALARKTDRCPRANCR